MRKRRKGGKKGGKAISSKAKESKGECHSDIWENFPSREKCKGPEAAEGEWRKEKSPGGHGATLSTP